MIDKLLSITEVFNGTESNEYLDVLKLKQKNLSNVEDAYFINEEILDLV